MFHYSLTTTNTTYLYPARRTNGWFNGPGPGAYVLPTTVGFPMHDPSRHRNPMYSFGMHTPSHLRPLGPGPAYRIDRVTRDGNVTSPAWSLGAK
ncbi:Uncharacterized protein OBRU01_19390 [Operophtera brumata]|uniref:Uncharacterized protein n=1 Tax=Operophtera brumata TaxID=104452 RepID=A0A0L7KX60_OPEBR|nr:Uncharacterized protein OBRU01_19390 [Operophtera brumata]